MIKRTAEVAEDSALREVTLFLNGGAIITKWGTDTVTLLMGTDRVTYNRCIDDTDRNGPFDKLMNLVATYPNQAGSGVHIPRRVVS